MIAAEQGKDTAPRLVHQPHDFVSVATDDGKLIYIGLKDRAEFDRIALPCTDHGEKETGHLLSKSLDTDSVWIIFQYWLKSETTEAFLERRQRERRDREAVAS